MSSRLKDLSQHSLIKKAVPFSWNGFLIDSQLLIIFPQDYRLL